MSSKISPADQRAQELLTNFKTSFEMANTTEKIAAFIKNYEETVGFSHFNFGIISQKTFESLTSNMSNASIEIIQHLTSADSTATATSSVTLEASPMTDTGSASKSELETEGGSWATAILEAFQILLDARPDEGLKDRDCFSYRRQLKDKIKALFPIYKQSATVLLNNDLKKYLPKEITTQLIQYMTYASKRIIEDATSLRSTILEERAKGDLSRERARERAIAAEKHTRASTAMTGGAGAGGATASAAGPAGAGSAGRAEPLPPSRIDNVLQNLNLNYPDVPGLMPTFFKTTQWTSNELKLLATINVPFYTKLASVFQKIQKDCNVKNYDMLTPDVLLRMFFPTDYLPKYHYTSQIAQDLRDQTAKQYSTLQKNTWAWNSSFYLLTKNPLARYGFLKWKEIQAALDEIQAAEASTAASREEEGPRTATGDAPAHPTLPREESPGSDSPYGPSPMREAALGRAQFSSTHMAATAFQEEPAPSPLHALDVMAAASQEAPAHPTLSHEDSPPPSPLHAPDVMATAFQEEPAPSPLHAPDPSYDLDRVEAPFRRESVDDSLPDGPSPMREAALGRAPSPLTHFERLLDAVLHREITHYTAEIHDLFHEANVAYSRGIKEDIFNEGYNEAARARGFPEVNTSVRPHEGIPLCPILFREHAERVLNRLKCELQGR